MVTFDYDSNTCVLGNTAVGAMVATIVIDSNGLYRVCKVFDRASDDNRIETKGEKINHTSFVQYFTLPGSNNPNEIVHPLQVAGDGIPSDTNQAVYVSFPDDKDVHFQHWYAFSDVDQEGYCVFFN